MTPTVVYAELLAAPLALFGSYLGNKKLTQSSIALICSLHIGIAFTVRNTVLLSLVACSAWCIFLPTYDGDLGEMKCNEIEAPIKNNNARTNSFKKMLVSSFFIIPIICGSIWFETISEECNQSMKHIWSVLLHNRWNVFVGAEVRFVE